LESAVPREILVWKGEEQTTGIRQLIGEEPLSIRVQGNPYAVVMRTPGDEIPHVAGFCLGEGIADRPADIGSVAFCDGSDTNVVTVTLTTERRESVSDHLERRNYISQSSCGLCGKEMVEELYQLIQPIEDDETRIDPEAALGLIEGLPDRQPIRSLTRAAHAAALYGPDLAFLSIAEDVGRHNALDKAIGKLFLDNRLDRARVLVMSSRISYELVQKAARARIPIFLAVSRPTALAVELADSLNMTLACLAKGEGLFIFCGRHRFNL
jgi:FdhD protein